MIHSCTVYRIICYTIGTGSVLTVCCRISFFLLFIIFFHAKYKPVNQKCLNDSNLNLLLFELAKKIALY